MAKIISKSRRVENVSYRLVFDSKTMPGAGYSFECDEHGKLCQPLTEIQQQSWRDANDITTHNRLGVERNVNRYTEAAVLECNCGTLVALQDPLDNDCETCGATYNLFGQRVQSNYGRRECIEDGWAYDENDY